MKYFHQQDDHLSCIFAPDRPADVKISYQSLSKQFVHQTKVLTKLFKNMEKIYGLQNGYEFKTQNTFQSNACFPVESMRYCLTIFGKFHNGEGKKTNANPNPTKNPNPPKP